MEIFMRIGRPRGFTYLGLLLALALMGAALAAAGQRWSLTLQRERERELVFRGQQIAAAIAAYRAASGVAAGAAPTSFDDLLDDRRGHELRRHLRRAYTDPFTGEADWELLRDGDGAWVGVRSRSDLPAVLQSAPTLAPVKGRLPRVQDHRFEARPPAPAAPSASAPARPAAPRRAAG
jgi:type II secretory pathway pseudopilin PulG